MLTKNLTPNPFRTSGRGKIKPLPVSGRGLERGLFSWTEMSNEKSLAIRDMPRHIAIVLVSDARAIE
jgi:hypothetical protein